MLEAKCDAMTLICFGQHVIRGAHPQPVPFVVTVFTEFVQLHMDISAEAVSARICNKNAADQNQDNSFVRACAAEMHMPIAQKHFYVRIASKIPFPEKYSERTLL